MYAVNANGSWRAVNSEEDLIEGETFSEVQPPVVGQGNPRVLEIDALLAAIDKKRARALSDAVLTGNTSYAQALEDQAVPLRAERRTLTT